MCKWETIHGLLQSEDDNCFILAKILIEKWLIPDSKNEVSDFIKGAAFWKEKSRKHKRLYNRLKISVMDQNDLSKN